MGVCVCFAFFFFFIPAHDSHRSEVWFGDEAVCVDAKEPRHSRALSPWGTQTPAFPISVNACSGLEARRRELL